jgi:hypothetical protein
MCEEFQLLKILVFPLSGEFSTNNNITHTTSSACKPSLLTIAQAWCFVYGFLKNAFQTHNSQLASCWTYSQRMVLWTFIIPISGSTTIPTPPWRQGINTDFSINVSVDVLGDHNLGTVVLPNRLTRAVYHHFCLMIYKYPWSMCLFINDNRYGSRMMRHQRIFFALSASTWTRLSVNSG